MREMENKTRFEKDRQTVIKNMSKSKSTAMKFLAENLKNMTYDQAIRHRHNYSEIWQEFLINFNLKE